MSCLAVEIALAVELDLRPSAGRDAGGRAVIGAGEDLEVCEGWGFLALAGEEAARCVVGVDSAVPAVLAVAAASFLGTGCGGVGGFGSVVVDVGSGSGEGVVHVRDLVGFDFEQEVGGDAGDVDEFLFCVRSWESGIPGLGEFDFDEWGDGQCVVVGDLGGRGG